MLTGRSAFEIAESDKSVRGWNREWNRNAAARAYTTPKKKLGCAQKLAQKNGVEQQGNIDLEEKKIGTKETCKTSLNIMFTL